jgi:hypothetical protein
MPYKIRDMQPKALRRPAVRYGSLLEIIILILFQVSNALIMDKGTKRNILTELHMNKNQYNLVTTMYYVCQSRSNTLKKNES